MDELTRSLLIEKQKELLTASPLNAPEGKVSFGANWGKPLVGLSAAVHPEQADEMNTAARKAGITGVFYRPSDGRVEYATRKSRARELKRRGLHDQDGGYMET